MGWAMIRGAHVVLYSTDADADRALFRDVLGYPFVDAGQNWLIFALPPAELAVHPSPANAGHELMLMCDDIDAVISLMSAHGIACSEPTTQRWGSIIYLTLPGGGSLGIYEPTHPSPIWSA